MMPRESTLASASRANNFANVVSIILAGPIIAQQGPDIRTQHLKPLQRIKLGEAAADPLLQRLPQCGLIGGLHETQRFG